MRICFLSPSFYPYRVPVFDELYKHFGEHFTVISLSNQLKENSRIALRLGKFPRKIIFGKHFAISRRHDTGEETPFGLTITPTLPFELIRLRPNLVIGVNFNIWTLLSITLGFRTIVFWEGTHYTERTLQPWRERLRRWMLKRAKGFVVNGKLSREYLEHLGAPPELIFEGGLCSEPPPIQKLSKPTDDVIRFLCVSQLIERKGILHLFKTIEILEKRVQLEKQYKVELLGDGPMRESYKELAERLGISHRISFLGNVAPQEVWSYYAKAHVFVLPTLQDNWPLVVPEAMSMGMPVLLSNYAGSVPDLMNDGVNGWVFDPENHEELAKYMMSYIETPALIVEQGKRSLERVKQYSPERVAEVYIEAVEAAMRY
jgi:glycosyltransferase involved in cell wall biosynthesis